MATIRFVPSVYPTFAAAHGAAVDGDTILLAPGTYPGPFDLTKRVHLKGDTTDPATVVVTGGYQGINIQLVPAATPQDLWIEGVTFVGGWDDPAATVNAESLGPGNVTVRFNRCQVLGKTYLLKASKYNTGRPVLVRLTNCKVQWFSLIGDIGGNAANRVVFVNCQGNSTNANFTNWGGIPTAQWAEWAFDVVIPNTLGYGPAYGTWYAEQWMGRQYALGGTVRPRGVDAASQWQCLIYRERLGGGMEATPWAQATPDPITGRVRVGYLPTDRRYYVAMVGPAGYQPSLHGPYDPAQEP